MPAFKSSAQAITWTDNFIQFQVPTNEQCNNWSNYLDRLVPTNYYASVKMSGSNDTTGISITDPAAAQQLASLLYTRTAGSVTSDGHTWYVGLGCQDVGSCVPDGQGVVLTIDQPDNCTCDNSYTIRPHIGNYSWGGIGDYTCNPSSQTMSLEFETGATITASGSTTLCQGDNVTLTASTNQCAGPYTYLWSTGETTQSITVGQSGDYSVTIKSSEGCSFYNSIKITVSANPTISTGKDVIVCANPAQLNATVINGGASSTSVAASLCLFDGSGGGDCTFTNSLCDDGYQFITDSQQFSLPTSTTITPAGINFKLYYSACSQSATFTFKLNDNVIGSFFEDVVTCACDPSSSGQYPRVFSFDPSQFQQFWNTNAANSLAVDVVSDGQGLALAGILAEVLSPNETYSWAPVAGLSDSTIPNPMTSASVSTTYKVTYTNSNGCSAESQVKVNVTCNQPPVAICKSITVSANNNCVGNAAASDFNGGSIDPDGGVLTYTVSPAGPYPIGVTTVQLTVTDSDNMSVSCETTVTVVDDVPPVVLTKNVAVQLNASGAGSIVVADVNNGSTDNCGIATYTLSASNFDCTNIGTNTVTLTVIDVNGNSSYGTAIITVLDNSPPVITCPSTITVNNDVNTCGAMVNYDLPSITDSCSGGTLNNPIINGSFESGNYEGWQLSSSSGSCGLFAIGVAGQTIYPGEDIFDHADNTVETANSAGLPYTPAPTNGNRMGVFLQNCGSTHNLYQDVTLPLGSISLCLDLGYNNLSPGGFTASQFIAIELRNPVNNAIYTTLFKTLADSPPTRPLSNLCFDITAFAGQQVRIQIMDASIQDYYLDVFYDNIRIVGGTSIVQTAGLPSGSVFPVGTTTNSFRATDGSGNSSVGSFDVIVIDNQAPTVVVQNRIVQLNSTGHVSILPADINNGSTDNCSIALLSLSKTNFDCTNIGVNPVILTVTDANGNIASATAVVTVMDTIPPTAIAKNLTIYLDSTGAAPISANIVDNGSSDNCGIATMTLSKTNFDCTNVGTINTVTLTVTDVNGNVSTATSTISVVDSIAPTIIGLPSNIILGACGAPATWTSPTASDNCSGVTIVQTAGPLSGDLKAFINGTTQNITYTATDASGNSTIASFTVTRPAALTSSMTTDRSYLNFGYTPYQFANITIAPSHGVGPYTVTVTMARPLSCSLVSGWDNETWYANNATNNNNSCSILLPPVSVGNVSSDGALTLSVSLMSGALITAIIQDANGCIATNQINIGAEDNRCVDLLSGEKIQICHKVSKNECTPMCVDESAVDAHIGHGDNLGICYASCTAPPSSASAKVAPVATTSPTAASDEIGSESALKDTDIVVEAYPNPFRSSIHVKLSNPEEKSVSMNMVDLLGRNVALKPADKTPEGTHVLDTEQLAIGMYFLQVKIGDRSKTVKLEKK